MSPKYFSQPNLEEKSVILRNKRSFRANQDSLNSLKILILFLINNSKSTISNEKMVVILRLRVPGSNPPNSKCSPKLWTQTAISFRWKSSFGRLTSHPAEERAQNHAKRFLHSRVRSRCGGRRIQQRPIPVLALLYGPNPFSPRFVNLQPLVLAFLLGVYIYIT
jgi:hypothetical protein